MQAQPYNNPLLAQGLGKLVSSFIGTPEGAGRAELLAAQALNENLTAQYRQAMDVGLQDANTNLGRMMIRALQAGNQYSGNAPKISAAIRGDNAGTLGATGRVGRPSSGGGGGGGAVPGLDPNSVIEQARNAIRNGADPDKVALRLKRYGIDPEAVFK